jgi:hypothetical protein
VEPRVPYIHLPLVLMGSYNPHLPSPTPVLAKSSQSMYVYLFLGVSHLFSQVALLISLLVKAWGTGVFPSYWYYTLRATVECEATEFTMLYRDWRDTAVCSPMSSLFLGCYPWDRQGIVHRTNTEVLRIAFSSDSGPTGTFLVSWSLKGHVLQWSSLFREGHTYLV